LKTYVKPKKHLGQHFLNDLSVAEKIALMFNEEFVNNQSKMIEIGPGMGVLTQFLVQNYQTVALVEIDHESIQYLKTKEEFLNLPSGHLPYVPGTAFLIHREIFKHTGDLDESLHTYWEDVDYSQRVRLGGLKMDLNLNFELIHKVGKTCHKDPFYTNHLFKRNRDIVSQRYRL
jgi:GT2 family glycosyltransferase